MQIWKYQLIDKDGKIVESAPKATFFIARGPVNKQELKESAARIANSMNLKAVTTGEENPGVHLKEDSITTEEVPYDAPLGGWQPAGAQPVALNQFASKDSAIEDLPPMRDQVQT